MHRYLTSGTEITGWPECKGLDIDSERDENSNPNVPFAIHSNYLRSLVAPRKDSESEITSKAKQSHVSPCKEYFEVSEAKQPDVSVHLNLELLANESNKLDFENHSIERRRESRARQRRASRNAATQEQRIAINQSRRQASSERRLRALRDTEMIARQWDIDDPLFFNDEEIQTYYCGKMEKVCGFCGAWYWEAEKTSAGKYTACCSNGAVKLPPIRPPPPYIQELLLGNSPDGRCFKKKARAFNSKLSFASVSMNQYLFPNTRGVPALRISGSIYHNIGAIHPEPEQQAKFLQCFFYESNGDSSLDNFEFSRREISIHNRAFREIEQFSPFLRSLRLALQTNAQLPLFRLVISDKPPPNTAPQTYNRPTTTEISAIMVGDGDGEEAPSKRDVIIRNRGGFVSRIPSYHSSYDPLAYAITYVDGDAGWTSDMNLLLKKLTKKSNGLYELHLLEAKLLFLEVTFTRHYQLFHIKVEVASFRKQSFVLRGGHPQRS